VEIPNGFRDKEVVAIDFSVEIIRRDVEVSIPSVEVQMYSVALRDSCLPGTMILIGVERVNSVSPCLIKAFDLTVVFLLSKSKYKVLVLDNSSVSEDNFVLAGMNFINTYVIRASVVLGESLSSGCTEVKLSNAE
jgi:hypothetical protein